MSFMCVLLILNSFLVSVSSVYVSEQSVQQKSLLFLEEVVQLDLLKYDVTLQTYDASYPAEYDGLLFREDVAYLLENKNTGGGISADFVYWNSTLIWCLISILNWNAPIYSKPQPSSYIEKVKGLLERLDKWSGLPICTEHRKMLDVIKEEKNQTVISGDLKLKITLEEVFTDFQWYRLYGELELPDWGIAFERGHFHVIGNGYLFYKVGSTLVNVSRDEAVRMARERAKNFSWKVGLEPNATEVRASKILDEPVQTSLSLRMREPLTLYPHWQVALYFDRTYPGFVIGVEVGIWADTGEIHYINPISTGGGLPPKDSSTPSPEPEPKPSPKPNFSNTRIPIEYIYAIVVIIAVTAASAIGYLHLKRKKSKT